MSAVVSEGPQLAPALWRRMACFLYEGLILFGIGLIPGSLGAAFFAISGQHHPLQSPTALRVFTFALYGLYFTWCWSKNGQTLPMQTWHIRLVTLQGMPVPQARALLRYLLSWVWVVPAGVVSYLLGWTRWGMLGAVLVGIVVYASLALRHPRKQFWHDVWSGTQLVTHRPPVTALAQGSR